MTDALMKAFRSRFVLSIVSFKPSVTDILMKTFMLRFVSEKTWRISVKRRRLRMINKLIEAFRLCFAFGERNKAWRIF